MRAIQEGDKTLEDVQTVISRKNPLAGKSKVPKHKLDEFMAGIETDLNGGSNQPTLPELTKDRKIELRVIQEGHKTLEDVRTTISRKNPLIGKFKMPEDKLDEFMAGIGAHLNGGSNQPTLPELTKDQKI